MMSAEQKRRRCDKSSQEQQPWQCEILKCGISGLNGAGINMRLCKMGSLGYMRVGYGLLYGWHTRRTTRFFLLPSTSFNLKERERRDEEKAEGVKNGFGKNNEWKT
jgi:hypothetical protein